jgi:1-acyl-sn-glycerol-3-phosphate acyltransferase
MNWLRTILYQIVFYSGSVLIVLAVPLVAPFGQKATIHHAHRWARLNRWAERVFLGVTTRVEGEIPEGQFLFAAKHQAMFETLELAWRIGAPVIVMKRELTQIPFWGRAAQRYGSIGIDRAGGAGGGLCHALRAASRGGAAREGLGLFQDRFCLYHQLKARET